MSRYVKTPQLLHDLASASAKAEIERLRGDLDSMIEHNDNQKAEIERLRTELDDQRKDTVCDEQRIADLMADVQRQGLEIERLRGLLREWLEGGEEGADTFEQRVREALGE